MKFKPPSSWPMQKRPIEVAQRITPQPSPGPPAEPMALNGAYCVQPPRVGPSLTKNEATMGKKAAQVTQNDIMLKCGKACLRRRVWMGKKEIAERGERGGGEHKKTMIVRGMVINCR